MLSCFSQDVDFSDVGGDIPFSFLSLPHGADFYIEVILEKGGVLKKLLEKHISLEGTV